MSSLEGVSGVYSLVLALGLTGVLIGVVLTVLGKMGTSVLGTANKSTYKPYLGINQTINSIYDIPNTWLPVIVIVAVAGIILYLVMGSLGGGAAPTKNSGERR
jgi:flagellar biosynthesis protein FlhB